MNIFNVIFFFFGCKLKVFKVAFGRKHTSTFFVLPVFLSVIAGTVHCVVLKAFANMVANICLNSYFSFFTTCQTAEQKWTVFITDLFTLTLCSSLLGRVECGAF